MWPCILDKWYPTIEVSSFQHKRPFHGCQEQSLSTPLRLPTITHFTTTTAAQLGSGALARRGLRAELDGKETEVHPSGHSPTQLFVTAGDGNFIYSQADENQRAKWLAWWAPWFYSQNSAHCMTFWYHVWFAVGTLGVKLRYQKPEEYDQLVWMAIGHQGDHWKRTCPAPQIFEALPGEPPFLGRGRQLLRGHWDAVWKLCKWDAGIIPKIISGVSQPEIRAMII